MSLLQLAGFAAVDSSGPVLLLHLVLVLEPVQQQCCAQPPAPPAAAQDSQLCAVCSAAAQRLPTQSLLQVSHSSSHLAVQPQNLNAVMGLLLELCQCSRHAFAMCEPVHLFLVATRADPARGVQHSCLCCHV